MFLVPVTAMFLYFALSMPLNKIFISLFLLSIWLSLAYIFFHRSHFPLKRIRADGERLLVSNYVTEIELRVSDISRVERKRFAGLEVIYLHLKRETAHGRTVAFMPATGHRFDDADHAEELVKKGATEK